MNRELVGGLLATVATGGMLLVTVHVADGYTQQVVSAAMVLLLSFAAIVLLARSLNGVAGQE